MDFLSTSREILHSISVNITAVSFLTTSIKLFRYLDYILTPVITSSESFSEVGLDQFFRTPYNFLPQVIATFDFVRPEAATASLSGPQSAALAKAH
jgi:hypothetical protein